MKSKELTSLVAAYERGLIEDVIRFSGGNVTKAARNLGVDRSNFYRSLTTLGVNLAALRAEIAERLQDSQPAQTHSS